MSQRGVIQMQARAVGFTLAELLIALAILGVIATFTIPKILHSQQDAKYKAIAKEAASMVSGAYHAYRMENPDESLDNIGIGSFTDTLNYVAVDTSTVIDHYQEHASISKTCNTTNVLCLKLHNGAMLRHGPIGFCAGEPRRLFFWLDPDGQMTDGTTDGPGKSVEFWLFENGRVTTAGNSGETMNCGNPNTFTSANDPPWFSWD